MHPCGLGCEAWALAPQCPQTPLGNRCASMPNSLLPLLQLVTGRPPTSKRPLHLPGMTKPSHPPATASPIPTATHNPGQKQPCQGSLPHSARHSLLKHTALVSKAKIMDGMSAGALHCW
jgi:hypothetical protein